MNYRSPDYPVFFSWIGHFIFKLVGWRVEGDVPDYPKMVITGAPHTSNWDGFVFIFTTFALRQRMNWLGKHTLFRAPIGWLMRLGGGVSINRKTTQNAVEQAVQVFNERKRMILLIAPEGTRKKTDYWKTGFYYIALGAKVPIVMAYVDYPRKRVGIGPAVQPTGDIDADFAIFRAFYADKIGRHPEKKSNVEPPPLKS
jgi:1-acyl-sn-glycerol-3-phosphate acyltransferase